MSSAVADSSNAMQVVASTTTITLRRSEVFAACVMPALRRTRGPVYRERAGMAPRHCRTLYLLHTSVPWVCGPRGAPPGQWGVDPCALQTLCRARRRGTAFAGATV